MFGSFVSLGKIWATIDEKTEDSSNVHGYQLAGKETTYSATFMSSASAQVIIKPNKKEWATNTCHHCSTQVACQFQVLCQLPLHVISCNCPAQGQGKLACPYHVLESEKGENVWSSELLAEHNEKLTCKGATITSKGIHDCNVPESTRAVFCNTIELTKHDIITCSISSG